MTRIIKRVLFIFTSVLFTVTMLSCALLPAGMAEKADYAPAAEKAASAPAASKRVVISDSAAESLAVSQPQPISQTETLPQPEKRKRVFSGACQLVVDDVEERKRDISRIAEESGGYVERIVGQTVVIRVPADLFHELFELILSLGEPKHKSIASYDVTDYYRDQETRLELAVKTRERLYTLLEKTTDVKERLAILREIKRLTEEIERIKISLELLDRQIELSRITIELIPRLPPAEIEKGRIPFYWIANLNPLHSYLGSPEKKINLELGDAFAVFEKETRYRAESPEGTRVRVGVALNQPLGDGDFWQKALDYHLKPFYRKTENLELGIFKAVLFTSKDREPFFYLVGLTRVEDRKKLIIVEVFFPDQSALDLRFEGLKGSIKQAGM